MVIMQMSMMKISLIISTYNRPSALKLCLESVKRQNRLPDEVIIGDDGSGDETAALIREFQKDFLYRYCMCGRKIKDFVSGKYGINVLQKPSTIISYKWMATWFCIQVL